MSLPSQQLTSLSANPFYLIFNSLYMAAAEAFYFAFQFEAAFNFLVVENAEAVDDGHRVARHFDYFIGCQFQVFLVPDCQHYRVCSFQGIRQVLLYSQFCKVFLVAEEARPCMAGCGLGVLFFKFPPVPDIGVVNRYLTRSLNNELFPQRPVSKPLYVTLFLKRLCQNLCHMSRPDNH